VPGFLLNAVRGVNGTTPAAHSAGAKVTLISTAAPSTIEDEGGCQIGAASHSSSGWLLLIPTVGLLVLRRRRR
jgi:MYXO-CTERM domain-containing protein